MKDNPVITVLCGSASEEAAVSRVSGRGFFQALEGRLPARLVDLAGNELPMDLDPAETVIFPALHGTFGEDGQLQAILEERGFAFAGSGAVSSRLCMDKQAAKHAVADSGFALAADYVFLGSESPEASELIDLLGPEIVIKPLDKGSSVGLHMVHGAESLKEALGGLSGGLWMAEKRVCGREMTVGLLDGRAMGVVEIIPSGGVYDYQHKYTAGATTYQFPADIPRALETRVKACSERVFELCGCRDFARVDFILDADGEACFLEINTIPGLTPTSLLPKSASCEGLDFPSLALRMLAPALARFRTLTPVSHA